MKKRIFVVDDDPSVRESLRRVLEESGYEVEVASDGAEAQMNLNPTRIDLLILDINMPKRDGWDVLEEVRDNHPLLPVVMITGMYDQLDTTIIPGVRALLKKPLEVRDLLGTIEELLTETSEERLRRFKLSFEGLGSFESHPHKPEADSFRVLRWGRGNR
jgi:DNA-binding response OmpR family regulator